MSLTSFSRSGLVVVSIIGLLESVVTWAQAGTPPQPNPVMSLIPFALMFGVLYLFIIRPQQKKLKEHQAQLEKLKVGDEVVTQGGIFGRIAAIEEKVVTVEVDRNVKLRILKSQVNPMELEAPVKG